MVLCYHIYAGFRGAITTDRLSNKQTILIVDDMVTNIKIASKALKDDWNVISATSGQEALKIATSGMQPDLILLDIVMPELDGYAVCKILKGMPETRDIPVIFLTGLNEDQDEAFGLDLGAIDYITKPFSASIVRARVKNQLELKRYRDILKEASMLDGLTGIPNRRRFDEALALEWQRGLHSQSYLSLIMIDIDFFKKYNDTYGHLQGDECLCKVAAAIKKHLDQTGSLASRWGGEEFTCLLTNAEKSLAQSTAKDLNLIVQSLQIPHKASKVAETVTISLGTATMIPRQGQDPQTLLIEADKALYVAKQNGRNQVYSWNV